MSFRNKTKTALKDLLEAKGEDGALEVIREGLEKKKFRPEDFSLRELWEACTNGANVEEAVSSSSFPKITGELINSRIINAYNSVKMIGDQLCTTVPSNVQLETVAGFTEAETPEEVGEGQAYNDSTFTEKYVTGQNVKYGRMISVTEEMVAFDKTGQVMERARRIGIKAAQYKEKLILRGIQDLDGTVYKPNGVAASFYTSAFGNLIASNPFGEEGMENVRKAAQLMKDDSIGSDDADYIYIDMDNLIVLVPADLEVEAWQMAYSTKTPESAENAENFFKGRFNPLTSPFLTSASATTWYWGNFKEDFWWTEVWPLQTIAQMAGTDEQFTKDIKMRTKTRFYGNIMAIDYRHSYKCTA